MNKKNSIFVLVVVSVIISILSYLYFPDQYASHWGANGMANGYSSKGMSVFLFPLIQVFVTFLMYIVPQIDPKKSNVEKFKIEYETFILAFVTFFTYIQVAMFLWNTYYQFNFSLVMIPALAALMFHVGTLVGNAKQNYMIGIRTPWTLAHSDVWDKTHEVGAKYIKVGAIVSLLGLIIPEYGIYISMFSIILPFVYAFIFSYYEYLKIVGKK